MSYRQLQQQLYFTVQVYIIIFIDNQGYNLPWPKPNRFRQWLFHTHMSTCSTFLDAQASLEPGLSLTHSLTQSQKMKFSAIWGTSLLLDISGIYQIYLKQSSGKSQVNLRHISGKSQTYLSYISGIS